MRFATAAVMAIVSARVQRSARAHRTSTWCGLVVVLMLAAGCSGGESASTPTGPTPTTPTSQTPTTPSTPSAPGNFSVGYVVSGGDCNATSNSPVSCTFVAQVTGGQAPFTYTWTFWAENLETVTMTGQSVRPTLDCKFSTGQSQFRIYFTVRVDQSGGGAPITVQNDQRIYRVAGHC